MSQNSIDDPRYVKALSHPLRVRILAMLQERTASPVQLAARLHATLGTVSYHVRTLHQLELIELVDQRKVRGAVEHYYRAVERPTVSDSAWRHATPMAKQAAVGAALQNVDEYARAAAAAGGFDHDRAHLSRTLLRLDEQGWDELAEECEKLLDRLKDIESRATERLRGDAQAEEAALDVGMVIMLFEAVLLSDTDIVEGLGSGAKIPDPPPPLEAS